MKISRTKNEYIASQRKKKKIKGKTASSPFTVISLDDPKYIEPRPVTRGVIEFKDNHFYGRRLPRKN
ncbi:12265_t:CDS:2, partial [Gigaspora rosea]